MVQCKNKCENCMPLPIRQGLGRHNRHSNAERVNNLLSIREETCNSSIARLCCVLSFDRRDEGFSIVSGRFWRTWPSTDLTAAVDPSREAATSGALSAKRERVCRLTHPWLSPCSAESLSALFQAQRRARSS